MKGNKNKEFQANSISKFYDKVESTFAQEVIHRQLSDDVHEIGISTRKKAIFIFSVVFSMIFPLIQLSLALSDPGSFDIVFFLVFNSITILLIVIFYFLGTSSSNELDEKKILAVDLNKMIISKEDVKIKVSKSSKIEITRYQKRFGSDLKSLKLISGMDERNFQDEIVLDPIKLNLAVLDKLKQILDIDVQTVIVDNIPKDQLNDREYREFTTYSNNGVIVVDLAKNDIRYMIYLLKRLLGIVLMFVIAGVIIIAIYTYIIKDTVPHATFIIVFSYPLIIMLVIMYRYLLDKPEPITRVTVYPKKTLIKIGTREYTIQENAKIIQKEFEIDKVRYLDSRIMDDGNIIPLPFYPKIEDTKKMNQVIADQLNLDIKVIV